MYGISVKGPRRLEFNKLNNAKPIGSMGDCPETANGLFNPATAKKGKIIYCRGEDAKGVNRILCYESRDGVHIDKRIGIAVDSPYPAGDEKHVGIEDPRAYEDHLTGKTYLSVVDNPGPTQANSLAVSDDGVHFNYIGRIFDDNKPDKDGAIMGRRPDGKPIYVRRIMEGEIWGMTIAIGKTEDIAGPYETVHTYYPRNLWEGVRTGASQFVEVKGIGKSDNPWFMGMHHGAMPYGDNWVYSSGLDLFDEEGKMIACASTPQIWPTTVFEKDGFEGKQVSLCTGLENVVVDGTEVVRAYIGAGDRHVMVTEAPLEDCIKFLLRNENLVVPMGCRKSRPKKEKINKKAA